ncbi:hypothetical protein ACF0H5_002658 [Mactra antiquata]
MKTVTKMGPKRSKKTPTKSTDTLDYSSFQNEFSPIKLVESPGLQRQGNLTGTARKLKDGAADLHNYIQSWNGYKTEGSNIISDIANIKLEKILENEESVDQNDKMLPESLLPLCEKLNNVLQKLEKITVKLSRLAEMCKGLAELEKYKGDGDVVLFQTWDIDQFVTVFSQISNMYEKEYRMKQFILENICHVNDRNSIMFYSSTWIHEPYIDINISLMLESVLLETNHKT